MNCSEVTPNPGKKINQFCKVVGDQQVNACTIYIDVLMLETHLIDLLNPTEQIAVPFYKTVVLSNGECVLDS